MTPPGHRPHVALYDGACGMCTGFAAFARRRGGERSVHWLASQTEDGQRWLRQAGLAPTDSSPRSGETPGNGGEGLDTVVVLANAGTGAQRTLIRSDASLFLLGCMKAPWRWFAILRIMPRFLRDLGYRLIARNRQRISRWLGRKQPSCPTDSANSG